jgi:hypothetical protein
MSSTRASSPLDEVEANRAAIIAEYSLTCSAVTLCHTGIMILRSVVSSVTKPSNSSCSHLLAKKMRAQDYDAIVCFLQPIRNLLKQTSPNYERVFVVPDLKSRGFQFVMQRSNQAVFIFGDVAETSVIASSDICGLSFFLAWVVYGHIVSLAVLQ